MLKSKKRFLFGILILLFLCVSGCIFRVGDVDGARAKGSRLERMANSPQWNAEKERFINKLKRIDGSWIEMTTRFFFGGSNYREPEQIPEIKTRTAEEFTKLPDSDLRITWFGHSIFLVEIEGVRTLVDPVWSERASPFTWAGPKRFYEPPIALKDLPSIDAVIISHDHYDHLDRNTVADLLKINPEIKWLIPLGVGAHLETWNVPDDKIIELDWWQDHKIRDVVITATPSRHFSGRSITFSDQNATLWAGWAWNGKEKSVFYSGDTALHPEFKDIGDRLGPFDVTLMEVGAYNQLWADVHLGPEQAIIAHKLVKGDVMIPVHWGLFDLALHGWTEPAERTQIAAKKLGIDAAILRPGSSYEIGEPATVDRWWPDLPWQPVEKEPAWSSSVEDLLRDYR